MHIRDTTQPHLEYRASGFHWRRRWPQRWISGGCTPSNKSSLLFSLRTHVPPEAKVLARQLTLLSDIAFAARTETGMAYGSEMMAKILQELGCFLVEAHELSREVAPALAPEAVAFEAACAQAAIDALRRAIALRDREPARQPLEEVAARLGVTLDPADTDWPRLAYRALRVMLDAAAENARRDQGIFDAPSPYFRSSRLVSTEQPRVQTKAFAPSMSYSASPAPAPVMARAEALSETVVTVAVPVTRPAAVQEPLAPQACAPASAPSEAIEAVVETPKTEDAMQMRLSDYFKLYIAKKCEGYTDEFGEEEVPDEVAGRKWAKSSKSNVLTGMRIWVDLLGDKPLWKISDTDIRNAKKILRKLPETHSKSRSDKRDLRTLIADTDAEEKAAIEQAVAEAMLAGGSPAAIERARLNNCKPRIRVETIVKHVRALNRPAKMLVKTGALTASPFSKHMITATVEASMRKSEEARDRRPWDDRIYKFLETPVFRGKVSEPGDPLFWAPLMALLGGGREEEILQLAPDDFETSGGIAYYRLRNMPGNSIKSESGERLVPVHRELVRLGLLKLVDLRRKQGEPRLFPYLKRGKNKETFTELFSKEFTKYRDTHKVYWRGLDFHALRTTFHHQLMDNLVPGYVKRRLMGHVGLDEGEKHYSQGGISIKTLHECVSRVSFDLSQVQSPVWDDHSEQKKSRLRVVN